MSDGQSNDYTKWLKSLEITISDPTISFEVHLKGDNQIAKFFETELDFWTNLMEFSPPIKNYVQYVSTISQGLEQLKTTAKSDLATAKVNWENTVNLIGLDGLNANRQHHYIYSTSEEAQLIGHLCKNDRPAVEGAVAYYDSKPIQQSNYQTILGYFLALNLAAKKRGLGEPADLQQASFDQVRNEITSFQSNVDTWFESEKELIGAYIEEVKEMYPILRKPIVKS